MIDLSYKKKQKKEEIREPHPVVQALILVAIGAYWAYIFLSAIAGEPIF